MSEAYEYLRGDGVPRPNAPDPNWLSFIDQYGLNGPKVPFRFQPGRENRPTWFFDGDERTGPFSDGIGRIGWSIFGQKRLVSTARGIEVYDVNGLLLCTLGPDAVGAFAKTNTEAFAIQPGQPVKLAPSGCALADSGSVANASIGISQALTAAGALTPLQTIGIFSQDDWTNVIGSTALTLDSDYYLGAVAGSLTENPVDSTGAILQFVGKAVTTTSLLLGLQKPIVL